MKIQDKEKSLIKNTGILALGTLSSKLFSFLLLPLYTSVLETNDYGTVDVLQTVAMALLPCISLQLASGLFRFIIDKPDDEGKSIVITSGLAVMGINTALFIAVTLVINWFWHIEYCGLFIVYFTSLVALAIAQNITRGFGNNVLYSLMSFIMTAVSLIANVVLILGFGFKGDSILIASTIAYYSVAVLAFFRLSLWKYIRFKYFSGADLKAMLKYCLPLIPNDISWWITNTSDRLLIKFFVGPSANGIYAAANKIPTIYTTIYNVYNLAWIESLARSANDDNQEEFINKMFQKSIKLFGCICLGIICGMSLLFNLLIGRDYADSYNHIYILMTAIFFNSLCSLFGGIFTAFKKSDIIGKTTVIGAIVNIAVNVALIPFIGLYAASVSTLVSYMVIALIRAYRANKLVKLTLPKGFMVQLVIMLGITTAGYFLNIKLVNAVILVLIGVWSFLCNKELLGVIFGGLLRKFQRKKK